MSSCKVIKLTAWGPVLLRAGQRGGVESTIGLPGGTCFFSYPSILMEVVFPHVTVQVLTLWDTGASGYVLDHAGTVHKAMTFWLQWSLDAAGFPTRGRRGCLRKGFVPSEPMNQLIKEKAGLPRSCVREEEKRGIGYSLCNDRGQQFSFTEGRDRHGNKKNLS